MKQARWSKATEKFKGLSKVQKIEAIAASVLTVAFLAALPVYAWFAANQDLETITKIKEPGKIILRAGKADPNAVEADPIVNFELKDIDIEKIAQGQKERHVFSVKPEDNGYTQPYKLVLAHTTNNPFVYTIYHASAVDNLENHDNLTLYERKDIEGAQPRYYKIDGDAIPMDPLNLDNDTAYGRKIAPQEKTDDYYKHTYDTTDTPEIYAIPVYSVSPSYTHPNNAEDDYDYYILELTWDTEAVIDKELSNYAKWNEYSNNKETDMIYITATNKFSSESNGN